MAVFDSVLWRHESRKIPAHGYGGAGEITDTDHEVTVRFTTESGEEITGKLDAYKSGFYEGKTVPVLYLPDDPEKFTYEKNGLLLPLIMGGAGVFLVVFGVIGLVRSGRRPDDGSDCDGNAPSP